MNKDESKQILDYLKRIDESINGPRTSKRPPKDKRPLSDRVDSVEKKVGALGAKVGALGTKVGSLETKFDSLDTKVVKLDDRVSEVQLGLATLAADTKAEFKKIDERFNQVDARFERVDARFDAIDAKSKRVDERFDAIDVKFKRVDKRFDQVDQKIDSTRIQIVDLVERVHEEVTRRVVDLEIAGPGRKGNGGRGSGGGGVPLAS